MEIFMMETSDLHAGGNNMIVESIRQDLIQISGYEVLSFGVTFSPNLQKLIPPSVGSMDFQDW